jgi:hypothetical protein
MAKPFIFGYHRRLFSRFRTIHEYVLAWLRAPRGIFRQIEAARGSDLVIVTERQRRAGGKAPRPRILFVSVYEAKG